MPRLAQRKWAVWRRKQRLEATTPDQFEDLLDVCTAFADPVLDKAAQGGTWDPTNDSWTEALTSG